MEKPLVRLLLANDGSMTVLLEALVGGKITAEVLSAEEIESCEYFEGKAIRRKTILRWQDRRLIYAVSYISKDLYQELGFGQDVPIGLAMIQHKIEQFREIYEKKTVTLSENDCALLNLPSTEFFQRNYFIYIQRKIRIHISETLLPDLISICS